MNRYIPGALGACVRPSSVQLRPADLYRAFCQTVGRAFCCAIAVLLLSTPAAAAAAADLRATVDLADLEAVVAGMAGHAVEERKVFGEEEGAPDISLRASDADGIRYLLVGTACSGNRCSGVMMQVRFDCECETVDLARVNKANLDNAAIAMWFDSDSKTLGVTRYVVLDKGVTVDNLRQNLTVLLEQAGAAAQEVLDTP